MTSTDTIESAKTAFLNGELESCETMLADVPEHPAACHLRGLVRVHQGQTESGVPHLLRACELAPRTALFENDLGVAYRLIGDTGRAAERFQSAVTADPAFFQAWTNLGMTLRASGDLPGACRALKQAVELAPEIAQSWQALGIALRESGDLNSALAAFEKALNLNPGEDAVALSNLGRAYFETGLFGRALELLDKAVEANPQFATGLQNRASVLVGLGEVDRAYEDLRKALDIDPKDPRGWESFVGLAIGRWGVDGAALHRMAANWGASLDALGAPMVFAPRRRPERLRVGWLSPDFRDHSCAYFIRPPLIFRDRARFEAIAFADFAPKRPKDGISHLLKEGFDEWHEIGEFDNRRLAARIAENRIDILLELSGFMQGTRAQAVAWKPAPVIISWLGFPCTTGSKRYDARIGDSLADPPVYDGHWTERMIRVEGSFLAYDPSMVEAEPEWVGPAGAGGAVSFGCFNNTGKLNVEFLRLWARILDACPAATLTIKENWEAKAGARARVEALAREAGLPLSKLKFVSSRISKRDHLKAYDRIDIALDTFPYNGTTTTCESLYMGVPVVSLAGERHAARVGLSLLTNVGNGELVARNEDEYVRLAIDLAQAPERLRFYRENLRGAFLASRICDGAGFARRFETALDEAWEIFASGKGA